MTPFMSVRALSPKRRPWACSRVRVLAIVLAAVGGVAPAHAEGSAATRLSVASYNVQFVTPDLPLLRHVLREWPGHKPNVRERAEAIAARLACFDIVALQETINEQRRNEMFERLEAAGRWCGKPSRLPTGRMFAVVEGPDATDQDGWLPLVGDELALASRLPVLATDSHVYRNAAQQDALAAKGVLHARLANGSAGPIDVFVTHLQAGAEHGEVRRRQIDELAAFVRAKVNGTAHPVFVLGDFNVRGSLVDRQNPDSDYRYLVRTLERAVAPRRLRDAWLVANADDPDTASGTKPRVLPDGTVRPHEERIDYLFVAGSDAAPRWMRRDFFPSDLSIDGEPLGHLSDHAALLAGIALREGGPAPRFAGFGP